MASLERAEDFVRHVLTQDLGQEVSKKTVREVAKEVMAAMKPALNALSTTHAERDYEDTCLAGWDCVVESKLKPRAKQKPIPFDQVVKHLLDAPPTSTRKPKAKRTKSK